MVTSESSQGEYILASRTFKIKDVYSSYLRSDVKEHLTN